jgi:hypothetical protein
MEVNMKEENIKPDDFIAVKGRKFTFKIPSPFDGCMIFDRLTAYKIPFNLPVIFGITSKKPSMPQDEFERFMKLCLKNCYEVEANGEKKPQPIQVIDEDNTIGIIGATGPLLAKIAVQYINFFIDYWFSEND